MRRWRRQFSASNRFPSDPIALPSPDAAGVLPATVEKTEKIHAYDRLRVSAPAIGEEPDAAAAVGLDRGDNICTIADEKMAAAADGRERIFTNGHATTADGRTLRRNARERRTLFSPPAAYDHNNR